MTSIDKNQDPVALYEILGFFLEAVCESFGQMEKFLGVEITLRILEEDAESWEDKNLVESCKGFSEVIGHFKEAPPGQLAIESPFDHLEKKVRSYPLSEAVEFYIWSFPYYRYWIESKTPIDALFETKSGSRNAAGKQLADRFFEVQEQWIQNLKITDLAKQSILRNTKAPWVRMRNQILKKLGVSTLGAVT